MFHLTRLLVIARYLETNLQSLFDVHRADQRKLREAETTVAAARAERDVAQAALLRNGPASIDNLHGAAGDLLEARAALTRAEAALACEQQRVSQLQVVLDQASFRPWYANTVDPDPDRTAEVDYQQRLIKAGDYHLQLETQRNDLAERNKTLVKEIATNKATISQLEWHLKQAVQDGEAEHFKKTWIDCLAEYQNKLNYPDDVRFTSQIALVPLHKLLKDVKLYNKYKFEFMSLYASSELAMTWLEESDLNSKSGTKHPTELGHEIWADYLYNVINQR